MTLTAPMHAKLSSENQRVRLNERRPAPRRAVLNLLAEFGAVRAAGVSDEWPPVAELGALEKMGICNLVNVISVRGDRDIGDSWSPP